MKMKFFFKMTMLLFVCSSMFFFAGCKKKENKELGGGDASVVIDQDGNTYKIVSIGTQTWMTENLKTTKYNDGTDIPNVTDNTEWINLSTSAFCWYDNDISNKSNGVLYNWYVVNTGKLCPLGWHVPSDTEWTILTDYAGGLSVAGLKLKATAGWNNDGNGTDDFGFMALPAGYRSNYLGNFDGKGNDGYWWSATEHGVGNAWNRYMFCNYDRIKRIYFDMQSGYSVRCIKD